MKRSHRDLAIAVSSIRRSLIEWRTSLSRGSPTSPWPEYTFYVFVADRVHLLRYFWTSPTNILSWPLLFGSRSHIRFDFRLWAASNAPEYSEQYCIQTESATADVLVRGGVWKPFSSSSSMLFRILGRCRASIGLYEKIFLGDAHHQKLPLKFDWGFVIVQELRYLS